MCFLKTRKRKNGVNWLALSPSWRSCCGALCCCGVVVHMSAQAHWLRTQRSQLDGLELTVPIALRDDIAQGVLRDLSVATAQHTSDLRRGIGAGPRRRRHRHPGPRSSPSAAQFVQGFFLQKKTAKTNMRTKTPYNHSRKQVCMLGKLKF